MRELSFLILNYLAFTLAAIILTSLQSALWLQIFGYFPPPYLWMTIIIYWTLKRRLVEGFIMLYIVAFCISATTSKPLNIIYPTLFLSYLTIYFLKDRLLWPGPTYFMMVCGLASVVFCLSTPVFSFFFEVQSIAEFHFFDWLISPLLTALFAWPCYLIFEWIDKVTGKESLSESESSIL